MAYGIIFWHSIPAFHLASILTSYLGSFAASVLTFSLALYLTFFLPYVLAYVLAYLLTFFSGILSAISSKILCGRGPAGNTLILCLLFGSGGEHCDLALAVEADTEFDWYLQSVTCSWICKDDLWIRSSIVNWQSLRERSSKAEFHRE